MGERKMESVGQNAYFDNAATTYPKPKNVYDFMDDFYRHSGGGSAGRGLYKGAKEAGRLVKETREQLKVLFHTQQHEVLFTPSATEGMNLVLRGQAWQNGMTVYISPFEHNAVVRVLHYLKKKLALEIVELAVQAHGLTYDLEKIHNQFQDQQPNVVVISHASNVCGSIAPVEDIFREAKVYGAITILDMAQTAGLINLDLNQACVDFAIFAGHKTLYGPFGAAGVLRRMDRPLLPLIYGGTGIDSANLDLPTAGPERYEAGSKNLLAIAGLHAALDWLRVTGIENIYKKEQENKNKLISLLQVYDDIQIFLGDNQIGVISCIFKGYASDDIGRVLNEQGVAVRTGLQCAPFAHRFLHTFPAGTVRFSVSYFTTDEDFQVLRSALDYIADND